MNDILRQKIKLLPSSPGVYKMYDAAGEVIYVGKAISLKNRVSQYFHHSSAHTAKVLAMISHIADFETIQVSNETEALSLESNLIKQYSPKYNILLKDDKNFPFVRIDMKKDFPRIEIVHKMKNDGAKYLGPYLSSLLLRESLDIIRTHYPIRHCKKDLTKAIARRERPCLMYHIKKCCAPCSGNVTREEYHKLLEEIIAFLDGDVKETIRAMTDEMNKAADELDFEHAAQLRDRIRSIERLRDKQIAIATEDLNADVFSVGKLDEKVLVYALYVRNGKIVANDHYRMDASVDIPEAEIMSAFLEQFYTESAQSLPKDILLYDTIPDAEALSTWFTSLAKHKVSIKTPQRGDKASLTELCHKNCLELMEKDAIVENRLLEQSAESLTELTAVLGLDTIPTRIECYDNSHLHGTDTVSAMVVFTDGQPDKKAYRKFRLKTVSNGDDLAAMDEVLRRRFEALSENKKGFETVPDLIVIDGGKTQLDVATTVLSELHMDAIRVIALAESNEAIYRVDDDEPLILPRSAPALKLIQRIRDEAHRFAITYQRTLRDKTQVFSVLDTVPGIGDKRKRAIFDRFVSLEAIKQASVSDLSSVPGMTKVAAQAVYDKLHASIAVLQDNDTSS